MGRALGGKADLRTGDDGFLAGVVQPQLIVVDPLQVLRRQCHDKLRHLCVELDRQHLKLTFDDGRVVAEVVVRLPQRLPGSVDDADGDTILVAALEGRGRDRNEVGRLNGEGRGGDVTFGINHLKLERGDLLDFVHRGEIEVAFGVGDAFDTGARRAT
jgi:hypothetical protein